LETARDDAKSLSAELSATVRKILDVDLKGQLLELRSQLSTLANSSPDQASTVQQAIARVDQIIDPFAAQQLRNVTGMQQFVHVDLPVDPKSGVEEARLQVFYRQRGQGTDGDEDDRFTVAILLKLSQLGDVLATVTGIDGTVSVGFTVDRPTAEDPLAASIDELRAGLTEAGHQGAAISVRRRERASAEADPGMWEEFLELEPLGVDAGGRLDRQA
jgi:ribosomal protein L29